MINPLFNPLFASGWGANSVWPRLTQLSDIRVAYPRVIGERQVEVDHFLQTRVPGFVEH